MKFSDVSGDISLDYSQVREFMTSWFRPDDLVVFSGNPTISGSMISQTLSAKEFVSITEEQFESIIFDSETGDGYDLYFRVCPVNEPVVLWKRGNESQTSYVPGVWVDLDCKPESFDSEKDIIAFLNSLPLFPTMVCSTGTGGIHAYWKLNWDEDIDKDQGKELLGRWWSFIEDASGGRSVDKLVDTARILRVPGSLHFGKGSGVVSPVRLIMNSRVTYSKKQIEEAAGESYVHKLAKSSKMRHDDKARSLDVDVLAQSLLNQGGSRKWTILEAISRVEDLINKNYSWQDILEPLGWNFTRQMHDGSWEVIRPGGSQRTAVVDWPGSPNVMSLLSTSEDTGLFDLKDAGIYLSKYRVILRLHYDDDIDKMVTVIINDILQKGREGHLVQ